MLDNSKRYNNSNQFAAFLLDHEMNSISQKKKKKGFYLSFITNATIKKGNKKKERQFI